MTREVEDGVVKDGRAGSDRPYPVICFDWGTVGRSGPDGRAPGVRSRVERLCALGVDVAVVAEDGLDAVDGALGARPGVEGRLFLLLSGGAEVYVAGPKGTRLIERRRASEQEREDLAAAADMVARALTERGVRVRTSAPRAARHVLSVPAAAVQRAFASIDELVLIAEASAHRIGLPHVSVTVGARRIVVALTDAGESMRWVDQRLVRARCRAAADLLVIGDAFGAPGGVEGGDARMLLPELGEATFVSVGDEGDGAPPQVLHVGGGHAELLRILDAQLELRERVAHQSFPRPDEDPAWLFVTEGFDPFREREVETWLTVANGHTGTRGSIEEGSAASTPATFVAGVFGDGTSDPMIREPVPAPDWLFLRLHVDGVPLNLANGEILEHRRVHDLRQGVVFRDWRQRDRTGRLVRVRTARFASLADRRLLGLRAEANLEEGEGYLEWESGLGITHAGGAVAETAIQGFDDDGGGLLAWTRGRNGGGHTLAVSTAPSPGSPLVRAVQQSRDAIGGRVVAGEPASVDRLAAIVAARSRAPSGTSARAALDRGRRMGYDELLRRHRAMWESCWGACDVRIDGDAEAQMATRFSAYHMVASAEPDNPGVSIGARGLSGMSYFCHVFWDTEIFVVPFFIYSLPAYARTLLEYRYHNLPGAREKARTMGHRGALFPWESADQGTETTPAFGIGPDGERVPILSGLMEHHISADVAWAVWEYWKATADDEFMVDMGVELMLETARFWASRAARERDGRCHIRVVVGPDEYHEAVDDNAYTNRLARWNIRRAAEALEWLDANWPEGGAQVRARLNVTNGEVLQWLAVAADLIDGFDPRTRLFEQFAGFYEMADIDPEQLRPRPMPADLLLGREVTTASKVIKQADVLMLMHVLDEEMEQETVRANYDYYEPITVHGSSLSPGIHAAVAARLGRVGDAMEDFRMACSVDLADNMGNAARGLHLATMGGIWQAVVFGFAGVRRRGEELVCDPHLPEDWRRVAFPFKFRGAALSFELERDRVGITVEEGAVPVRLGEPKPDGVAEVLGPGEYSYVRTADGGWKEGRA
jgi:trehalose/maltose hydrolase-like predicted phosphorylase